MIKQIEFVTFHQSMSYEDFVEGIKPKLLSENEEEAGDIQYEIVDGIFKQMCINAAYEYVKKETDGKSIKNFLPVIS